jgi:hypothetical protein
LTDYGDVMPVRGALCLRTGEVPFTEHVMHEKRFTLLATLLRRLRKEPPAASRALRPFQAVSIFRGVHACEMAHRFSEHRFLAREAPTLPLSGCTQPATCECRYLKHGDRRGGPRRVTDFGSAQRFRGSERRLRDRRAR